MQTEFIMGNSKREKSLVITSSSSCGGVCGRVVNTSNSGSGDPGFKPGPSRVRRYLYLYLYIYHIFVEPNLTKLRNK